MDLDSKLKQVCDWFCIQEEYVDYETIQVGNVNCTYKVNVRRPDGSGSPSWFRMSIPMPLKTLWL